MTHGSDIFSSGTSSLFLPDLTLWFQRNTGRDSLPEDWRGLSLEEICRDLDVPCFSFQKPWRTEYRGVKYTGEGGTPEKDASGARIRFRRWETSRGTLAASWTLGPDGDWWQTEYPVKSVEDISAALEIARARIYVPEPFTGGPGGALELPMRPYSEVLHSFLGWNEGFMIALEAPETITEITAVLEDKYLELVRISAAGPAGIFYAPDNLDGRFIPPDTFTEHLLPGYAKTAEILHRSGKRFVVHAGGSLAGILPGLAEAGVDVIEGVAGPPQGDTSLAEARHIAGPGTVLWGGLAQDYLLSARTDEEFRAAAAEASSEAQKVPGTIFGVADRVPADALPERIRYLAGLGKHR